MKKYILSIVVVLCGLLFSTVYLNDKFSAKVFSLFYWKQNNKILLNNTVINTFFKKNPNLKTCQSDVLLLYQSRKYIPIWHTENSLIPLAKELHDKMNSLNEEGITTPIPHKNKLDLIFKKNSTSNLSPTDTELLLSSYYIFYVQHVFYGIDSGNFKPLNWFIPRKTISYKQFLDSILSKPQLLDKDENFQLDQYYKLRTALKKHLEIEKKGDWQPIQTDSTIVEYKLNDSSKTIGQIRHRLTITGDLKQDSKSNVYDNELLAGILHYKKRNGYTLNHQITSSHIYLMNIPIEKHIKTIRANMERCRWISPETTKSEEYIIINIPSYKLIYVKNGKTILESNIFVGKSITETAIFKDSISHIILNPYWNIPKNIVDGELRIAMEKDKNYLNANDMERHNGIIRQKPGKKNPLGQLKFMFPNIYAIYLHDSPSKSLFQSEYRALSHGCINMDKAKELALLLLKNDPEWPIERIENTLKENQETKCILKKKIPIYIGYFTAWVNDSGEIGFYNDIYERDERLINLLNTENKN